MVLLYHLTDVNNLCRLIIQSILAEIIDGFRLHLHALCVGYELLIDSKHANCFYGCLITIGAVVNVEGAI